MNAADIDRLLASFDILIIGVTVLITLSRCIPTSREKKLVERIEALEAKLREDKL